MRAEADRLARLAASEPSRFLYENFLKFDDTLPVLDAPCGFGRNSLFLAGQGYNVVGADIDAGRINFLRRHAAEIMSDARNINLVVCNLDLDILPFRSETFGSVLIDHFIPSRWKGYLALLRPGGLLMFETMGGQGRNYLQLPTRGQIRSILEPTLTILLHRERPVGPSASDAVTVRLVAQKR